jgi:cytochrome c biogenesis protein
VSEVDVRRVDLRQSIEARLGSAHKTLTQRELRNVGPSVTYKLRDAAGQAVEYHNYMLPVDVDGSRMFLLGVRETPSEPFRFLRVPADDQDSMDGFLRLRNALANGEMRAEAVRRYVATATDGDRPELVEALTVSARRAIDLFAGQDSTIADLPTNGAPGKLGGLQAVSSFMEVNVPAEERERAGEVLLRILNGTLFELFQLSRERVDLPPAERSDATADFMTLSVLSLSDSFYYPAPLTFQLEDFEHVQASVFQVARAPGQSLVYFGCLLLIIGVFAMLYVREKRLWIWLAPPVPGPGDDGVKATMAMSTNRKLMDNDRDFQFLRTRLLENKT